MRVAVLGTGKMGAGMVRSLLRAGYDGRPRNRWLRAAASVLTAGAGAAAAGCP